jgi:hypothetical protein
MYPENHALLTIAVTGAQSVFMAAPLVILAKVSNEDLACFRDVLVKAREAADFAIGCIDSQLRGAAVRGADAAEEKRLYGREL